MYQYFDTIVYSETNIYWKPHLKLNTDCVKNIEIGSLHSGSILGFLNMFGFFVHSVSIDQFQTVINILNIIQNSNEI